jgi:integrase
VTMTEDVQGGAVAAESGPARAAVEELIDAGVLDRVMKRAEAGELSLTGEGGFLPEFQGREIGSLEFDEIETWDNSIPTRISARGRPYARSVANSARSLLITILGDAVHAGKIDRNPAERRKGRRGRMRAKGRVPSHAAQQTTANVITPFQALCLAERCALLSGHDIDFVMNVFATWTGVRWGELLAVEGWAGKSSPLQLPKAGIATYAADWQLRELGGIVRKSAPKDGSYRVLDLPPFLADLTGWAMDNRRETCLCPLTDGRPTCKGDDKTPPNYLFLGPKGGHPRRSNYADDFLTPAAEGLHPLRNGVRQPVYVTAEPWPGIPIRRGNRKQKAADMAAGTWPNLISKFKPHDDRHSHATWLDDAGLSKVIQMDRRGHAMQGMDRVYMHVTPEMRQRLCDVLEELWQAAVAQRCAIDAHSHVPLLDRILRAHETAEASDLATQTATREASDPTHEEPETAPDLRSPLTESNRRPSPYHPHFPGFTTRQVHLRASGSAGLTLAPAYGTLRLPDHRTGRGAATGAGSMPSERQHPRRLKCRSGPASGAAYRSAMSTPTVK